MSGSLKNGIHSQSIPSAEPMASSTSTSLVNRKRDRADNFEARSPKKKKHKTARRKNLREDETLNFKEGINMAIGNMDSSLLADHVAQRTKRFAANLSALELEDRRIPGSAFSDTSHWGKPRTLDEFPSFLEDCSTKFGRKVDKLASASETPGSPHTLVIASAGLRAADLTRASRTFQSKDAAVAKLFAKHIKMRQAIDMVKKTRIGIGVGTPSRIIDLLDSGALLSTMLERIVVDCSHIDQKKRGILDMRETQEPLIQLLNRPELKNRYGDGKSDVQLIFY